MTQLRTELSELRDMLLKQSPSADYTAIDRQMDSLHSQLETLRVSREQMLLDDPQMAPLFSASTEAKLLKLWLDIQQLVLNNAFRIVTDAHVIEFGVF